MVVRLSVRPSEHSSVWRGGQMVLKDGFVLHTSHAPRRGALGCEVLVADYLLICQLKGVFKV